MCESTKTLGVFKMPIVMLRIEAELLFSKQSISFGFLRKASIETDVRAVHFQVPSALLFEEKGLFYFMNINLRSLSFELHA